MTTPSIEVIKDCLRIKTSDENFLIKKDCILGYGEKGDSLYWYLTIYTTITGGKIIMAFQTKAHKEIVNQEPVKEEYRKCRKLLDSILSPEVQKTEDLLTLTADNIVRNN